MKFKAVIFDLFGTLIDNFSKKEHDKVYASMTETLSAPYEAFRQVFGSSFSDRCIGKFRSIEENIAVCCSQIGLSPVYDARPDIIGWRGLSIAEIEELPELLERINHIH